MLSGKLSESSWCVLNDIQQIYKPEQGALSRELEIFLRKNDVRIKSIDLIISGASGDAQHDAVLNALIDTFFDGLPQARFKHLSGEYCTATAFAVWLGASILKRQQVPEIIVMDSSRISSKPQTILIINHYMGKTFTYILLKRV
jgi:3-oxoacyl-[acyl-carrier-protein] synthase II